jgi:hypothetical protein
LVVRGVGVFRQQGARIGLEVEMAEAVIAPDQCRRLTN